MALATYNGGEVHGVFYGIPLEATGDGEFVSVEYTEDQFKLIVGTNGDACRSKTNNRSGKFTVKLGQWDATNMALSAIATLDISSPNGDGVGPIIFRDNSGLSLYSAETAWIVKPATSAFAREAGTREWVIETNELNIFNVGGN